MTPGGGPRRPRGALLAAAGAAAVLGWWLSGAPPADAPEPGPRAAMAATAPTPLRAPPAAEPPLAAGRVRAAGQAASSGGGPPLTESERQERRALWQGRLQRARQALDGYREAARYPHGSRPITEHPDQLQPFAPVIEERPLRMPGGTAAQGLRLVTSQERIFLSGAESARVTLSLQDTAGRALPMRVLRAVLHELTEPGRTAQTPQFVAAVNDAGQSGDAVAGDGVHTAWVQPGLQGFGAFAGQVRLELHLEHAGQPGFVYFDFVYSPELAARWLPGVREALDQGSLDFFLKAEVRVPGRYVVSARVDDDEGRPFALALFNAEVGAGVQEFRLPVFGRLVRDLQPAFPLRLRDVEAFLLRPDVFPDRVMLPRLAGVVHRSRRYEVAAFSEAAWSSDERSRYLAELQKDVDQARRELAGLGP